MNDPIPTSIADAPSPPLLQQHIVDVHVDTGDIDDNDDDGDGEGSVYSEVEFTKQLAQSSLLSDDAIPLSVSQFGTRPQTLLDHDPQHGFERPSPVPPIKHLERRQRQRQRQYPLLPPPASSRQQQQHLKQPHPSQDDEDDQDEYKFLVRHLQKENEQLLIALQRSHDSLIQCRQDKRVLEDMLQDQRKITLDQELQDWIDHSPTSNQVSNNQSENNSWNKSDMEAMVVHLELQQARDAEHRDNLLFQKRYLMLANAALESCEQESLNVMQQLGVAEPEPTPSPWFKCRACVWAIIAVNRFQRRLHLSQTQQHRSTSRIKSTSSYSVY